MFYWYALLAGSLDTRTVRCVVTATTPSVSLRFAKTTATAAETATEGITRRACTRPVLLPFTNWEYSNINVSDFSSYCYKDLCNFSGINWWIRCVDWFSTDNPFIGLFVYTVPLEEREGSSVFLTVHDILTYLLTPWCRVLEKLTGLQLVKKFPAFYGTRRFITALTSVRHLSLSCASPIQSTYPPPTSWRSILILSTHLRLGLPSGLFPSGFPTKALYAPLS